MKSRNTIDPGKRLRAIQLLGLGALTLVVGHFVDSVAAQLALRFVGAGLAVVGLLTFWLGLETSDSRP